jgi:hypothetical protein
MQEGGGETSAGSVYRGLRARRGGAMLGEINVTPLVDVVLVLLLVFMVTAPMMSRGIDVALPVANQPKIEQEDRHHGLGQRRGAASTSPTARSTSSCSRTRSARSPEAGPKPSSTCAPTKACATAR